MEVRYPKIIYSVLYNTKTQKNNKKKTDKTIHRHQQARKARGRTRSKCGPGEQCTITHAEPGGDEREAPDTTR
jgi:hypothetical protein